MESQNNSKILKPSKRFLVRGGIASGIIILILTVQTNWFLGLFNKKNSQNITVSDATVGDIIGKDSNSNGIADWEERLWGLDPTVSTTNGVSNKVIIEEKRRNLQSPNENSGELNETDKLARELFGFTTALGAENGVNQDSLAALASKLGKESASNTTIPTYTLNNITTVSTTKKSLLAYNANLASTLSKYNENLPEIDNFIRIIETQDYSNLDQFDDTVKFYTSLAKKLSKISTPVGVAQYHLDIINSIAGIGKSFEKMKVLEDNGILALVGLSEYRVHDQKLTNALDELTKYLQQYGIIK